MRHRDLNSFKSIEELIEFFGDANRIGRCNTWIGKNYNLTQLILDLQDIKKRQDEDKDNG